LRRVAVTGLGVVSALGVGVAAFREGLRAGRHGFAQATFTDAKNLRLKTAAEASGYDPGAHFDPKRLQLLDRHAQLAVVAAREAVRDAGGELDAEETAVVFGTGAGGKTSDDDAFERLYGQGDPRVHPLTVPRVMPSSAASHVTMEFGLHGPATAATSACSSSAHAIGMGMDWIRHGRAEAAIVGGAEACLTLGTWKAWESLRVMAPEVCRPFSLGRQGMILGEGAAALVLEPLETARSRGARIYAELAGYGASADASHIVEPNAEGAARAIERALRDAGLAKEEIDYVNAHGAGTEANDRTETRALRTVFGEQADRLTVSSTKSMHGHALGASAALEAAATVLALREGWAPPTANFAEPDPACDLDVVPNQMRESEIRAALSNSFAFGGLNAVLAFRRA